MTSGPPPREALTLDGPAGRIEALLDTPAGPLARAVGVVCHPHPQHQGTMLNKVVHTLSRALNDLQVPAVRFNFRGVGASEGAYADGLGETDDALAVAAWAQPVSYTHLTLRGMRWKMRVGHAVPVIQFL